MLQTHTCTLTHVAHTHTHSSTFLHTARFAMTDAVPDRQRQTSW